MRCKTKIAIILAVLLVSLCLIPLTFSRNYYLTHPSYFRTENNMYISFDSSLYPLMFTTLYKDSSQRWYFNSTWISSSVDMEITSFFSDNWFNYSAVVGHQYIYCETKPSYVYFNDAEQTEGVRWTWGSNILTVYPSGVIDVGVLWSEGVEPEEPEEPSYFLEVVPPSSSRFHVYAPDFIVTFFENDTVYFVGDYWLKLDVDSGTLNGSDCELSVYDKRGVLKLNATENCTLICTGLNATQGISFSFSVSGGQNEYLGEYAYGVTLTEGNYAILQWNYGLVSWIDLYFILWIGLAGLVLMVASPTWLAFKIRSKGLHEETFERAIYATLLFIVGFGLFVIWLWN